MFVLIAWWELIRGNGWGWLWRVSDWWRHLRKHLGINATNYFMYQWTGAVRSPPSSLIKFRQLLHLNQASVYDFISNLTDVQASAF